jgi:hypothetical protein
MYSSQLQGSGDVEYLGEARGSPATADRDQDPAEYAGELSRQMNATRRNDCGLRAHLQNESAVSHFWLQSNASVTKLSRLYVANFRLT